MIAENPIAELLAAPLSPDWTIESLAEQLLDNIAAYPDQRVYEFALDIQELTDRQSQRLLRPLLAYLATGTSDGAYSGVNLYKGKFSFLRPSPAGEVRIAGRYENVPGNVNVVFWRTTRPAPFPDLPEAASAKPIAHPGTGGAKSQPPASLTAEVGSNPSPRPSPMFTHASIATAVVEQETERLRQVVIAAKSNPDVFPLAEKCRAKLNAMYQADPEQFSPEDIRWVNVLWGQLALRLAEHDADKKTYTPLAKRKGDSLDHCWRCKTKIDERFLIHPDCDSKGYHWRKCPVCGACGCQRNGTKLV